ncbi:MAG: chloramphenicol acetyltransferase [Bacteroidota bacterium]
MKKITYQNPHRKKHFAFFLEMGQPHFNICANVDITAFRQFIKQQEVSFNPAMVYMVTRTANEIPEFRHRIRNKEVVEHDMVHPSFTVTTADTDVFSFCYVDYQVDFQAFMAEAKRVVELMKTQPSVEDEPGRDDYLFLSSIPWVSFTSMEHAMPTDPIDSVPRIVWGKFFEQGDRTLMPLSVQAHHAIVDGVHLGRYFQHIQALLEHPEPLLSS